MPTCMRLNARYVNQNIFKIAIKIPIFNTVKLGRKLPAWRPGDENDLCARFQYHYEEKCFKPKKVKLNNEIEVAKKTGTDRLQSK